MAGRSSGKVSQRLPLSFSRLKDPLTHARSLPSGVYHYPISFTIPVTTPPTIHADFGSVVFRLKAVVHRAGALTSNYSDEKEVRMVACPGEDDTEETENVIVERQWEEQLRYLVALSGRSFPIGGQMCVCPPSSSATTLFANLSFLQSDHNPPDAAGQGQDLPNLRPA